MKRFTVLGFTEAELGFVLAALFAAMAVGAVGTSTDVERLEVARDSVEAARVAAEAQRDSLERVLNQFRDSVARAGRSNKTPRCTEKGEPPGAVADVRVLGGNSYELGGAQLEWSALRARLDRFISRADSLGCRYLLIARASSGVDAAAHTEAVGRLLTHFDVVHRTR